MRQFLKTPLLAACCIAAVVSVALAAQMMSVQVRSGQLRDKPAFLSKVVTTLAYGDRVDVVSEKDDWRKVKSEKGGKAGWMHSSALTEQEIILNPTEKDVEAAASSDELALAGKGFNKQVEEEYQKQNRLDYSQVDEMEKVVVPQKLVQGFLKEGKLKGGAQ